MIPLKKAKRLTFQPVVKPFFLPPDSPLAKSPLGQLLEVFRQVPADKITVWPINPDHV